MQKVLPFKKWESHKLLEREHFSDQDSEDESEEFISDEEIVIPKRKQKNKPKPKLKKLNEEKKIKSDVVIKDKPKEEFKQDFNIASMLKDLRNEKSNLKNENKVEVEEKEDISQDKNSLSEENFRLSISEIDLLRQQLSGCWNAPAGAVIEKGMLVKISAKINIIKLIKK